MKLLITGALGHIGSYIINDLLKLKIIKKIILLDNVHSEKFNVCQGTENMSPLRQPTSSSRVSKAA